MGHTEFGSFSVAGELRLGVPQTPASRLSPPWKWYHPWAGGGQVTGLTAPGKRLAHPRALASSERERGNSWVGV
jgi:hypothetical protein